jgi:hypothetical protein
MKTKIFFAAVAIIFSINASRANQSNSELIFWSAMGEKLVQPIMAEENTEAMPANLQHEYKSLGNSDNSRIFDLSEITKDEEEEKLPYYVGAVYHSDKRFSIIGADKG